MDINVLSVDLSRISMDQLKEMLDKATRYFGVNDIITIMLSQKLDKYMVEEQLKKCNF